MFNLDVISVNIWAILASLANLLILTWILKRFLFKPVKKMLDARRAAIDADYAQAHRPGWMWSSAAIRPGAPWTL